MRTAVHAILLAALPATACAGDAVSLTGEWWQGAPVVGRNTTLVASFDSATSSDADYAVGMPLAGGFGIEADVPGQAGHGVRVPSRGGHLHFRGEGNVALHRGTVRFAAKGAMWSSADPRTLFEVKGPWRIGVRREPGALVLYAGGLEPPWDDTARVELPLTQVSADEWHTVVASWDRAEETGLIALDGAGVRGPLELPATDGRALVFYLGGGFEAKYRDDGIAQAGEQYDGLGIWRVPAWVLEARPEPLTDDQAALLERCEAAARRAVEMVLSLEVQGGWHTLYSWPTLLGSFAQGRAHVDAPEVVDTNKYQSTPRTAGEMLYAFQVTDDYRCLAAAQRSAELLLAAQAPEGWWVRGYRLDPRGVQPLAGAVVQLQDRVQSSPTYFMCAMWRQTGDERYLQAARRCGEFMLRAQNPNGSWSHHFVPEKDIGETALGLPGGGELNDGTINDGIDMMALMHHMTGERAYVEAMRRAGEWLLRAQLTGATVGWAQQYDAEDRPVWARGFEPAAWAWQGTEYACEALSHLYRFSGDERYLQAIERTLAWVRQIAPDGEVHAYYDPATGRPIAAWDRQVYALDDPAQAEAVARTPIARSYLRTVQIADGIQAHLDDARSGADRGSRLIPGREWLQRPNLTIQALYGLNSQDPSSGMWLSGEESDAKGMGVLFSPYSARLILVLRYVQAARAALGEIDEGWRGEGILEWMARPEGDWYDVDWPE